MPWLSSSDLGRVTSCWRWWLAINNIKNTRRHKKWKKKNCRRKLNHYKWSKWSPKQYYANENERKQIDWPQTDEEQEPRALKLTRNGGKWLYDALERL